MPDAVYDDIQVPEVRLSNVTETVSGHTRDQGVQAGCVQPVQITYENYKPSDGFEEATFGAEQTDEIKYQNYKSSEEFNPAEARLNEHFGEQYLQNDNESPS